VPVTEWTWMRIAAPEALDESLTASIGRNQVSSPVRDCRPTGKVQQTAQQTLEFQLHKIIQYQ